MYGIIKALLFKFDPEKVHYFSMNSLQTICAIPGIKQLLQQQFCWQHPLLEKNIFGLTFKNPVGLGAGFDKNALYLQELEALGFGFVEIGTVTPKPQAGNELPRLFRLPTDKALINRMGFNNNGVAAVQQRLQYWKNKNANSQLIVGGNIGKNKITDNADAYKDYLFCFNQLFDVVDYFVVNVSSPNTPGLRALQEKDALLKIIGTLQNSNAAKTTPKPLLLKIAPDLNEAQLNDIVALVEETKLSGLVVSNTTIERNNLQTPTMQVEAMGMGGVSGKPVQALSNTVLKYLVDGLPKNYPIIASGGIFTANDANQKMQLGASLVQVWTGFVYEGPSIVKNICKGLVAAS